MFLTAEKTRLKIFKRLDYSDVYSRRYAAIIAIQRRLPAMPSTGILQLIRYVPC